MNRASEYYLRFYNLLNIILWSYCMFHGIKFIIKNISNPLKNLKHYDLTGLLFIVQTLDILDVINVICGLVRNSILVTFLQIGSRICITWFALIFYYFGDTNYRGIIKPNFGPLLCVMSWSMSEVIRYSFYLMNQLMKPGPKNIQQEKKWDNKVDDMSADKDLKTAVKSMNIEENNNKMNKSNSKTNKPKEFNKSECCEILNPLGTINLIIFNLLTKLRYSMFFILYPIGIFGEILSLFGVQTLLGIPYEILVCIVAIIYPTGFYRLFMNAFFKFKQNVLHQDKKESKPKQS